MIRRAWAATVHAVCFVRGRLGEPSTWIAFGAGVAAANALSPPWSYLSLGCAMMAAMIPNQRKDDQC